MNKHVLGGWLCVLSCMAMHGVAHAQMIKTSGHIMLPDGTIPVGTKIRAQVDINRNGKLESFETIEGTVKADGTYSLAYALDPSKLGFSDLAQLNSLQQIVTKYQKGGFAALVADGPLAVVLTVERAGYGTVVERFNTMGEAPKFDAVLKPLAGVRCGGDSCASSSGGVVLSGFGADMGAAQAYAEAYAPGPDKAQFPGTFSDSEDNLLVSSGFTEISLFDAEGKPVHEMSKPVGVRYQIDRSAWKTLPDLQPDSGVIELPMYSFDSQTAQWVREDDGELLDVDGQRIPESSLKAIHAEIFKGDIFAAFSTMHFSYFNCDAPISVRTCVKGRLVDADGKAFAGVMVTVEGVSYQGDMGLTYTGKDGSFASDLVKTESVGEDVDQNGRAGETFTARVRARNGAGVFVGKTFDSPSSTHSVGSWVMSCQPQACDCVDLGDIKASFEAPRLCKVTVHGVFNGDSTFGGSEQGPLADGAAVVGAQLSGSLEGESGMPVAQTQKLCANSPCGATLDADGSATFSIPVVGDQASLALSGSFDVKGADDKVHTYSGSVTVNGCGLGKASISEVVEVEFTHSTGQDLGNFFDSLFGNSNSGSTGGGDYDAGSGALEDADPFAGCSCRIAPPANQHGLGWLSACVALGAFLVRRRRA